VEPPLNRTNKNTRRGNFNCLLAYLVKVRRGGTAGGGRAAREKRLEIGHREGWAQKTRAERSASPARVTAELLPQFYEKETSPWLENQNDKIVENFRFIGLPRTNM
jgi:hypothetical protein